MEREETKIVIPEFIVRDKELRPFEEKFTSALNLCKDSYQKLSSMRDLENVPSVLSDINPEIVNTFIDERIAEISRAKILTYEPRKKAKQDWEAIRSAALGYVEGIQKFLSNYPDAEVTVIKGKVLCANADALVVEHCKIKTPKEVYEHVELIQKVKDAIEALQNFEKAKNYPNGDWFNVEMDIKMLAEPKTLVENWVWQEESRAYREKHSYLLAAFDNSNRIQMAERRAKMEERAAQYQKDHPDAYPGYHR